MEDDADDLEQEMDPMDLLKVRSAVAVALVAFKPHEGGKLWRCAG